LSLSPLTVFAFTNGEPASVVLGQPSFTSFGIVLSNTGMGYPSGVAVDSSGNVWVADYLLNRVTEFASPYTNGEAASIVLGQSSFTSMTAATSQTGDNGVGSVAVDSSGNVWVADTGNNRVLEFEKGSGFTNGEAASIVLGQPSFTSRTAATSQTGMNVPEGVAVDASGNVWVADTYNNRVLEFVKGLGFIDGQGAALVLGQSSFTTNAATTSNTGMNGPLAVAVGPAGNVWVADGTNNRVLQFPKGSGFTNGEAASLVLGQSSFTTHKHASTKTGMNGPTGIAVDSSGNVWVVDLVNNRVLQFHNPVKNGHNGQAASVVLGQSSFTSHKIATTQTGMYAPFGVAIGPAGNLWVADQNNNRVLQFLH
jgi:sugar lactone lactonase YvrE